MMRRSQYRMIQPRTQEPDQTFPLQDKDSHGHLPMSSLKLAQSHERDLLQRQQNPSDARNSQVRPVSQYVPTDNTHGISPDQNYHKYRSATQGSPYRNQQSPYPPRYQNIHTPPQPQKTSLYMQPLSPQQVLHHTSNVTSTVPAAPISPLYQLYPPPSIFHSNSSFSHMYTTAQHQPQLHLLRLNYASFHEPSTRSPNIRTEAARLVYNYFGLDLSNHNTPLPVLTQFVPNWHHVQAPSPYGSPLPYGTSQYQHNHSIPFVQPAPMHSLPPLIPYQDQPLFGRDLTGDRSDHGFGSGVRVHDTIRYEVQVIEELTLMRHMESMNVNHK